MDIFMIFLVIVVVVALFRFIYPNKKSGHAGHQPGDQPVAHETGLMWFPGNEGGDSGGDSAGDGSGDSFDGGSADGGGGDSSSF